jgi:hypothetical protein
MMTKIIDPLRRGVPTTLEEIVQLGRTLHRRRHDVLAHFDHHTSNGPTEAINGRLEALRRTPSDSETSPTTESLTPALRQPYPTDQCTLKPQEPRHLNNQNRLRRVASPCPVTIGSRTSHQILSNNELASAKLFPRLLRWSKCHMVAL